MLCAKNQKELLNLGSDIKTRQITTAFYPLSIKADSKNLTAIIEGDLHRHLGKSVTKTRKTYRLKFLYTGSKLALLEFQEVSNEK